MRGGLTWLKHWNPEKCVSVGMAPTAFAVDIFGYIEATLSIPASHTGRFTVVCSRRARHPIGKALYSSTSQIALRFLTRGSAATVPVNEEFIRYRINFRDQYRNRLGVDPQLSRRIYSEGDFLPGLIVDRYGDTLVVQNLCQGIDKLEPLITSLLQEQYKPRSIVFRNDARVANSKGFRSNNTRLVILYRIASSSKKMATD